MFVLCRFQVTSSFSSDFHYPMKLIEFKYLKKNDTEIQFEKAVLDEKNQVKRYLETRQMKYRKVDSWIMIFSKDSCIHSELIE